MTSILGIQANAEDNEAVILAADTLATLFAGPYEVKYPYTDSKIKVIDDFGAIATCGHYDRFVEAFLTYIAEHRDYRKFLITLNNGKATTELDNISNQLRYLKRDVRKRLRDLLDGKCEPASDLEKTLLLVAHNKLQPKSSLDTYLEGIFQNILNPIDPLREAIRTPVFYEISDLNRHTSRRIAEREEDPELDKFTQFVIATSSPLEIYNVDFFGGMIKLQPGPVDIDYISVGSGSEYLNQYLTQGTYRDDPELKDLFPEFYANFKIDSLSSRAAFELAYVTMLYATKRDPYSGGELEIAVVQPQKKPIKVTIEKAKRDAERSAIQAEATKLSY